MHGASWVVLETGDGCSWANLSGSPHREAGKMFLYEANGCEMTEGAWGNWGGCVDCRVGLVVVRANSRRSGHML